MVVEFGHWIVMVGIICTTLLGNVVNPLIVGKLCDWEFALESLWNVLPRDRTGEGGY